MSANRTFNISCLLTVFLLFRGKFELNGARSIHESDVQYCGSKSLGTKIFENCSITINHSTFSDCYDAYVFNNCTAEVDGHVSSSVPIIFNDCEYNSYNGSLENIDESLGVAFLNSRVILGSRETYNDISSMVLNITNSSIITNVETGKQKALLKIGSLNMSRVTFYAISDAYMIISNSSSLDNVQIYIEKLNSSSFIYMEMQSTVSIANSIFYAEDTSLLGDDYVFIERKHDNELEISNSCFEIGGANITNQNEDAIDIVLICPEKHEYMIKEPKSVTLRTNAIKNQVKQNSGFNHESINK